MGQDRKTVQLEPGTFKVLRAVRERVQELEGERLTLDQTIQMALVSLSEAPAPPEYDARLKRTIVSVIGQLLVQVNPEMAKRFRGVAFNSADGMAVLNLEGQDEPLRFMARDPVDMVRN